MKIEEKLWKGEPALCFSAGGYEALIIAGVGANVIQLKHLEKGLDLLRTPDNPEEFKEAPQCFGIPLLFPPNRIEDGTYTVNGKKYSFPINEPARNNHIHGFISKLPFDITRKELLDNGDAVEIEAVFVSDASNAAIFEYFPHEFECRLLYRLSRNGLEQTVTFVNNSSSPMPLGVGFHTAFNVPFHTESKRVDYRLVLSADKKWELSSRSLPTGNILPLNNEEEKYRRDGMMPFVFPLDTAYTSEPLNKNGDKFHGAILIDTSRDIKLYYEVGEEYKHWTVWNCGGDVNFVCPEPQTWAINAPNIDLPEEATGLKLLPQGERWSAASRIYIK